MKSIAKLVVCLIATFGMLYGQVASISTSQDIATTQVGTPSAPLPLHSRLLDGPVEGGTGTPVHPFVVVGRHPKTGCAETAVCGEVFYRYEGHNLRTSAGTTWQYGQMAGTPAAVGNYLALTNTGITPAEADTTLSGEIAANGLSRAAATVANASTTLAVPGAATATVVGTTGSTSYYYWIAACNQGICTTPSLASNNVTTANATLSTTNYVSVAFTGQNGASNYQVYRTTSNSAPSGTATVLVGGTASCNAALACTMLDQSNTLTSVTIPASNLTNFGKYTLVYTWTCATASQSAQAYGVFNASSAGTLIFEGTFTPVALNPGDTFQLTETIFF